MAQLRKRKQAKQQNEGVTFDVTHSDVIENDVTNGEVQLGNKDETKIKEKTGNLKIFLLRCIKGVLGSFVTLFSAALFCRILFSIHENHLWFSHITEVEKEISFRTESGLYYSYMKELIKAKSIKQGLSNLMRDNMTEYGRSINIIERFNIFQEILTGTLYLKGPAVWRTIHPMMFYVRVLFSLQSLTIISLSLIAWIVSSSVFGAITATTLVLINYHNVTRAEQAPALRENWASPFYFVFLFCAIKAYKPTTSVRALQALMLLALLSCSVFCLFWQFNQFILLLTSIALYGSALLNLVPRSKTYLLMMIMWISLIVTAIAQFGNKIILTSFCSSFIPVSMLTMAVMARLEKVKMVLWKRMLANSAAVFLTLLITVILSLFLKKFFEVQDDSHILKFLFYKFNPSSGKHLSSDFDSNLYLCEKMFNQLELSTLSILVHSGPFIPYSVGSCIYIALLGFSLLKSWHHNNFRRDQQLLYRPELTVLLFVNIMFAFLAVSTVRFKFFWISSMCVLAAIFITDCKTFLAFTKITGINHSIVRFLISALFCSLVVYYNYEPIIQRVNRLSEFHDPDTVDLIHFLKRGTPKSAVFTATMQVCAMLKLGTGRAVTNHPHFENEWLRRRTVDTYQIYSKLPAEDIHSILLSIGTTHIVLETSICYQRGKDPQCKTKGVIDLYNQHMPDHLASDLVKHNRHLTQITRRRFCAEVFNDPAKYSTLFQQIFVNDTFRVFKVLR